MTGWRTGRGALLAMVLSSQVATAADPRYPDWPCQQAKVPEISLAAVWAGPPLGDAETKWRDDPKVSALATKLAARRIPLEDAQKQIAEFLQSAAADKANAGKLLFAGLFDTLNGQRASVMNGLERVMRKQREAAEKIRDDTIKLQALQDATPPDQAKVDELGNQLVWETRIFEDRGRVVKFVCEVPTTIDQRLFALSRTIQQELD
ncbi:MAG: branched-chain amino acid transport system permease [Bradyrhizobium sp. DFCI-1]|nr:MAG: branched-chain amino acid transport system permease [Bradyrhizobium sp. DFCI-1]